MRHLVLHLGNDDLLADARIQVLEDAGYEVVAAVGQAALLRLLRTRAASLVVVCHSVPPDELESTVQQIRRLRQHVSLIAVHLGGLVGLQRSLADGFVDGLRGPQHLVSQVASFVTRNISAAGRGSISA